MELSVNFAANLDQGLAQGVQNLVKAVPERLVDTKVSAEHQDFLLDDGLNLRDVGCLQKLEDLDALEVGILARHLKRTDQVLTHIGARLFEGISEDERSHTLQHVASFALRDSLEE